MLRCPWRTVAQHSTAAIARCACAHSHHACFEILNKFPHVQASMPFDEYVKYWNGRARYVRVRLGSHTCCHWSRSSAGLHCTTPGSITHSTEGNASSCLYLKDWHFANQFGHRYRAYTTPNLFKEVLVCQVASPRVCNMMGDDLGLNQHTGLAESMRWRCG